MKAVVITPGVRESSRLQDVPAPAAGDGRVLVRVLEVGIDATDREIAEGLYGGPPAGDDFLILGHESLGRVEDSGEGDLNEGDLVVATVRRPCPEGCPSCLAGESDMCSTGHHKERGIDQLHGYLAEYYAEETTYLISVPEELKDVAVLLEPMSIAEKVIAQAFRIQQRLAWEPRTALVLGAGGVGLLTAFALRDAGFEVFALDLVAEDHAKAALAEAAGATYLQHSRDSLEDLPDRMGGPPDLVVEACGHSPYAFAAMRILAINGVLALVGASGGSRRIEVPADATELNFVLGNRLVFGCVNSNAGHFRRGLDRLAAIERRWPGLLSRMITRRLPMEEFAAVLAPEPSDGVKTVVEIAQ